MTSDKISFKQLVNDLRKLGLKNGDLVNVKASLKSIGNVDGGAKTLLDALVEAVGPDGTIVTESFIRMFTKTKYSKNNPSSLNSTSYAGALANEILKHPQVFLSTHPVQRFASIGKKAKMLMENHTGNSRPYNVLFEMISDNGINLRIGSIDKVVGVGTTHVALDKLRIQQKRLPLFVHHELNGTLVKFKVNWAAGCEEGFNGLFPYYYQGKAVISEGNVGNAEAMITDMKKTYNIEIDLLRNNFPSVLCKNPACINCNLAYKNVKKRYLKTIWELIKRKKYDKAYLASTYLLNNNYQPKIN